MKFKWLSIKLHYKYRGSVKWQMTSKKLRSYALEVNDTDVGLYTYGSCFDSLFNSGGGSIQIGRYCSFAGDIHYFGANHPIGRAVMSPIMYNPLLSGTLDYDVNRSGLIVGNDVWLGYGVVITSGCNRIGNGAVIGAGSIVTHDIEPYSIVVGSPARELKKRFDEKTISVLEKSRWWELASNDLMRFNKMSYDPEAFANAIFRFRAEHDH